MFPLHRQIAVPLKLVSLLVSNQQFKTLTTPPERLGPASLPGVPKIIKKQVSSSTSELQFLKLKASIPMTQRGARAGLGVFYCVNHQGAARLSTKRPRFKVSLSHLLAKLQSQALQQQGNVIMFGFYSWGDSQRSFIATQ